MSILIFFRDRPPAGRMRAFVVGRRAPLVARRARVRPRRARLRAGHARLRPHVLGSVPACSAPSRSCSAPTRSARLRPGDARLRPRVVGSEPVMLGSEPVILGSDRTCSCPNRSCSAPNRSCSAPSRSCSAPTPSCSSRGHRARLRPRRARLRAGDARLRPGHAHVRPGDAPLRAGHARLRLGDARLQPRGLGSNRVGSAPTPCARLQPRGLVSKPVVLASKPVMPAFRHVAPGSGRGRRGHAPVAGEARPERPGACGARPGVEEGVDDVAQGKPQRLRMSDESGPLRSRSSSARTASPPTRRNGSPGAREAEPLAPREYGREVVGAPGTLDAVEIGDVEREDGAVEEDEGAEGLVLRGGRRAALDREVVREGGDLGGAEGPRFLGWRWPWRYASSVRRGSRGGAGWSRRRFRRGSWFGQGRGAGRMGGMGRWPWRHRPRYARPGASRQSRRSLDRRTLGQKAGGMARREQGTRRRLEHRTG
jgi:hypothetical protein